MRNTLVSELIDRVASRGEAVQPVQPSTMGSGKGKLAERGGRTASGMLSDILFCRRVRLWRGRTSRGLASKADERESDQDAQR